MTYTRAVDAIRRWVWHLLWRVDNHPPVAVSDPEEPVKGIAGIEENDMKQNAESVTRILRAAGLHCGHGFSRESLRVRRDQTGVISVYAYMHDDLAAFRSASEAARILREAGYEVWQRGAWLKAYREEVQ